MVFLPEDLSMHSPALARLGSISKLRVVKNRRTEVKPILVTKTVKQPSEQLLL